MRVVAIIQARMGSTRLPGKVLMDIGGETMLSRVVNRVRRATRIDETVVATTLSEKDEPIISECRKLGVVCFLGSEEDVLDRYYQAALAYKAEGVVRITSDCPLIDPGLIDRVVRTFVDGQPQTAYAYNVRCPRGMDTEVIRFDALKKAWEEDGNPAWREHVTPYIAHSPKRFPRKEIKSEVDFAEMRWTVDTADDLALVRRIYDHLKEDRLSWSDVMVTLNEHSEWLNLNRHVKQKTVPEP
jgi:spore coat polysaccharide biosynthesis protein SpsF